ncbi:MAG: fibrobacter succinogenes major paralogous domain-containing protein [Bacteroidales bacterium]
MAIIRFLQLSGILAIALILSGTACTEDNEGFRKDKISGCVQKGPFINGSQVLMFGLNADLGQSGKTFSTQISDNAGTFEIDNISLASRYVELSVSGFYFNENSGWESQAPLTLYALADVADVSTVNINILTHLERLRVKQLVSDGQDFSAAKAKAQSEILSLFNMSDPGMENSEQLDISKNTDENAILLALSVILQGSRSVGTLTELLAELSNAIKDGIDGDSLLIQDLRGVEIPSYSTIRQNLVNRYESLGITAEIPNFEKYLDQFFNDGGQAPEIEVLPVTDLDSNQAMLHILVNPNSLSTTVSVEIGQSSGSYGYSILLSPNPISGNSTVEINQLVYGASETEYHYRVKAENRKGIVYSDDHAFVTLPKSVYCPDGSSYKVVKIGTQAWMAENLRTTVFNDNTSISLATDSANWFGTPSSKYCWFSFNEGAYSQPYGALYNWYAVNTGKLCPTGWHVPSDEDWNILVSYLGGESFAGNKLKEAGDTHWAGTNEAGNESGFSALPGGVLDPLQKFQFLGMMAFFWSSTAIDQQNAIDRILYYNQASVTTPEQGQKKVSGLSVRCVRN